MDGVEGVSGRRLRAFEDAGPHRDDPSRLRDIAQRDGFLFIRGLVAAELVAALRDRVLDYASRIGWLHPNAPLGEARAAPGKRIGSYDDPAWVNLQVEVQTHRELWALGDCPAIHRVLHAIEGRSADLDLSTANTCRIFSPHPDTATQPHQDAHYVRLIDGFWTVWLPLGDCPMALGTLALLPGSHHGGLRAHCGGSAAEAGVAVPEDAIWSTADLRTGDAIFFRSHTIHCSLPNRSGDGLRLSADFRYGVWEETSAVEWRACAVRPDMAGRRAANGASRDDTAEPRADSHA